MSEPLVTHDFVSPKADGPDTTVVRPGDWNDPHKVMSTDDGLVLGRRTGAGAGAIEELPLSIDNDDIVHMPGHAMELPKTTTAGRPAVPVAGYVGFNTDLQQFEIFIGGNWMPIALGTGTVPVGGTIGWYSTSLPAGYLWCNADTMGSAASGATRASDLYQALFILLWNNLANAQAPVSGGRGASATADWAANKTIRLPDHRGRVTAGMDTMGGAANAGRLDHTSNPLGPDGLVMGSTGGESVHTLVILEMPKHHHNVPSVFQGGAGIVTTSGGGGNGPTNTDTDDTGGDGPHNNVQQTIICNTLIKF